ncbi:Uncharacterized protein HZ326_22138 [Fusarium oxysporum f. sp. albedinis]|nr:Uncharacterized protein HZ326_22138 [Fusarium oxysporum f. sp. albedinis]
MTISSKPSLLVATALVNSKFHLRIKSDDIRDSHACVTHPLPHSVPSSIPLPSGLKKRYHQRPSLKRDTVDALLHQVPLHQLPATKLQRQPTAWGSKQSRAEQAKSPSLPSSNPLPLPLFFPLKQPSTATATAASVISRNLLLFSRLYPSTFSVYFSVSSSVLW